MSVQPHGIMKVEMSDAGSIAEGVFCDLQMASVCSGQCCFVLLCAQQVDGMYASVLLREINEMALKCGLRRLRTRNLDTLTERLQALLLPEDWGLM